MNKQDNDLKDKVIGKAKELEGKVQQAEGKVKAKAKKIKEDFEEDHQIAEDR